MNRRALLEGAVALGSGALFGVGLLISGMTRPTKVIGFLDVFGAWDASLLFVMAGAIAVHFIAYRLIRRRPSPVLTTKWALPTRQDIDFKLVLGAALFGVGWGLGGYCPGPALVSLGGASLGLLVFVGAMLLGMTGVARLEPRAKPPGEPAPSPPDELEARDAERA